MFIVMYKLKLKKLSQREGFFYAKKLDEGGR